MQFATVQEFPLDPFTGFQADRRSQGQREINIQPGRLALGPNGLNLQCIFSLHIKIIAYGLPFLESPESLLIRRTYERFTASCG